MGAWGFRSFENDDALDWVDGLSKTQDNSFLVHAFVHVPSVKLQSFSVRIACRALAAAEVVAALSGIRHYIAGDPWDGPDLQEDLRLCYSVILKELKEEEFVASSEARRAYLHGYAELLREIMLEIYGEAEPYEDIG